ncbi:hypothetical protein NE237_029907 [Protea cynaroides]|uniref:Pentatricopeptide repeat-containing protein n=1 Tax=Protea cynaroides TaxID=273540 RepID=A0A9Q0JWH7_9MAGN|nr:hypothetical protein NE237_029907 [Protea cynaroides]
MLCSSPLTSYYNIMILAKCRSGNFQEARDLLVEIRKFRCHLNANSYNYLAYLLSCLKDGRIAEACNLLNAMEEGGYTPDAEVTFEAIVHHACRNQKLDFAIEFLK